MLRVEVVDRSEPDPDFAVCAEPENGESSNRGTGGVLTLRTTWRRKEECPRDLTSSDIRRFSVGSIEDESVFPTLPLLNSCKMSVGWCAASASFIVSSTS